MPRPGVAAVAIAAGLVVGIAIAVPLTHRGGGSAGTGSAGGTSPATGGASPTARPSGAAPGSNPAAVLYQQALAATRGASGVHYDATTSGGGDQHTVGDAGRTTGTQDITVTSSYGAEQFKLVLVGGTVYFQGNAPAAQDQLGVSATKAPDVAGKWVAVTINDGPYGVLQPGITTADQAKELPLVATTTESVTEPDGTKATRIHGTLPSNAGGATGTATLDVATGTHLPITYTSSATATGTSFKGTTTFSHWGTAPTPAAPTGGAVPWSSLGATTPPGGYGSGGQGGQTPQSA